MATYLLGAEAAPAAQPPPLGLPCTELQDLEVRVCQWDRREPDRRVRSWDGVPLDARVVLPAGRSTAMPLVAVLGGYPGGLVPLRSEYILPSPAGLARRGYAVLTVAPRGTFHSCGIRQSWLMAPEPCLDGYVRLADSRYEVRDVQHLAGRLADEGYVDPRRVGAAGESYGGGQALQLAALRDRVRLPDGTLAAWRSPGGRRMRIAGVTAATAWNDLGYSLVPNGRLSATRTHQHGTGMYPPGVQKASLYAGFEALSVLGFLPWVPEPIPAYHPQPGRDPDADFYGWGAALQKGEPYDEDPMVGHMLRELRAHHSAAGIPVNDPPAPVLFANGFADDLFPADEAVRYLSRMADVRGARAAASFGDWGHGRARNLELDVLRGRTLEWLDRWVKGDESVEVLSGVEARPLDCSGAPVEPVRARDWQRLSADRRSFDFTEPEQGYVVAPGGDTGGEAIDPVAAPRSACKATTPGKGSGTLTYDAAPIDALKILGSPAVTADIRVLAARARDAQLAARLWDVDPDTGAQRLISRALYRPREGSSAVRQSFELHGTGWVLPAGHSLRLELLASDPPFGRPSNLPFALEVSDVTLHVPVAR